jgi:hypothetical protein
VQVGNGIKTNFWEDQWIGSSCLAKTFPRLFIVSMIRTVTTQEVFDKGVEELRFRRVMVGELREQWGELKKLLERVNLDNEPDRSIWKLTNSRTFSVKSF